jgi:phosphoribosylanthranilate isomerase
MMAKVCGLTSAGDVALALDAGADLLGFLQHPASPRHCPDLELVRLAGDRAILVVVAAEAESLMARVRQAGAGWVQPYLPAAERAQGLARLRADGRRVLLPWPDDPDQEALPADLYLWETSPKASGLLGGSGQGHPMGFPPPGPFLLGGGLEAGVLAARLAMMPPAARPRCRGFDAASRLERAPGRKDPERVAAFVGSAHGLE